MYLWVKFVSSICFPAWSLFPLKKATGTGLSKLPAYPVSAATISQIYELVWMIRPKSKYVKLAPLLWSNDENFIHTGKSLFVDVHTCFLCRDDEYLSNQQLRMNDKYSGRKFKEKNVKQASMVLEQHVFFCHNSSLLRDTWPAEDHSFINTCPVSQAGSLKDSVGVQQWIIPYTTAK